MAIIENGIAYETIDLDVMPKPEKENLTRLICALKELKATMFHPKEIDNFDRPDMVDILKRYNYCCFETPYGQFDVINKSNNYDYNYAHANSEHGILSIPALIAFKTAAGRAKDKSIIPVLQKHLKGK